MNKIKRAFRYLLWRFIIILLRLLTKRAAGRLYHIKGLKIYVSKNTFPPFNTISTELLLDVLNNILDNMMQNKATKEIKLCDMGTGTGIIGIFAARKGCSVIATDIQKEAIIVTKLNAMLNGVRIATRVGDLFSQFSPEEKFDIIIFNPPYFPFEPKDIFSYTYSSGRNYATLIRFLRNARKHLKQHGFILITLSNLIDEGFILTCATKLKYTVEKICERRGIPTEVIRVYRLSPSF